MVYKKKMKLKFLFILIVLVCTNLQAQFKLEGNIFLLDKYDDQITLEDAINLETKGLFNIPYKTETYFFLEGKEAGWLVINIPKQEQGLWISIQNSLLEELNFYQHYNNIKKELSPNKGYRFPIVSIAKNTTPCKLYIRTKDALSYRTEFIIKSYNLKEYEATMQKDYFVIGSYAFGLLVLLISASIIFLYKKKFAVLWYMIHLTALIIEYLISTGTFSQWFVSNDLILTYGLDHFSLLISTMALSEFFRNFYAYGKKTMFCKHIYLAISIACGLAAIFSIVDGLSGNMYNVEFYSQTILNYASLLSLIIHFILVFYRVIPLYLFFAFLLPVLGIFANLGDFKNYFNNPNITYFIFQSVYLGILIEVIVIIFYIIKESVDGELLSVKLSKENNELKNNFQEEILTIQEVHQNALVNDVHDSFGGYIEALKLNLLQKDLNGDKINTILNSFKKDYRFLLNSLYIPNINSTNFEEAILDYVNKMNQLSKAVISYNSEKDKFITIPQNTAKLLFKSVSELTTNAIKHANANQININLRLTDSKISLNIKDDGKGFKKSDIKNTSFGLTSIKDRIESLNGTFILNSTKEKGTEIIMELSLNELS